MKNIFYNITPEEQQLLLRCLDPQIRKTGKGERILDSSNSLRSLCILIRGKGHEGMLDSEGRFCVLQDLTCGSVFGNVYLYPLEGLLHTVISDSACETLFLSYDRVLALCERPCVYHMQFLKNLMGLEAERNKQLALHLSIVSRPTIRARLLSYLTYLQAQSGGAQVEAPISLLRLAEYLHVDRSAMMREIRKMKEEGSMQSKGRQFRLLK